MLASLKSLFCYVFQFLAESLDVVNDNVWVISLGDAFARQYDRSK